MPRVSRLAIAAAAALGGSMPALADIGPKPTMAFTFAADVPGLGIVKGELLQCAKADCSDAQPLRPLGPQHVYCNGLSCNALAYGFSPYGQLRITFSDGRTLTSNVFQPAGFNAKYRVQVSPSQLAVAPQ
jgi:hypothetical protein